MGAIKTSVFNSKSIMKYFIPYFGNYYILLDLSLDRLKYNSRKYWIPSVYQLIWDALFLFTILKFLN